MISGSHSQECRDNPLKTTPVKTGANARSGISNLRSTSTESEWNRSALGKVAKRH